MSDEERQQPRPTRLYEPIEKRWVAFEKMMKKAGKNVSFNWFVNLLFAHRFGIEEEEIEQYRRGSGNTKDG